jgi:quercetin dioxygenase-like cupin family protein
MSARRWLDFGSAIEREAVMNTDTRIEPIATRRRFNSFSLHSLFLTVLALLPGAAAAQPRPERSASTRRDVIKQRLPGEPERDISLVEVSYPPGTGSPPHLHANGVIAFVVSGAIVSKVGDGTEQTFHAGDAWWEPRVRSIGSRAMRVRASRRPCWQST